VQYRTGIFYHTQAQRVLVEAALKTTAVDALGLQSISNLAIGFDPAFPFWPAESHHQNYEISINIRLREHN
jgi:peptide methionine sulfoxide reductase MsrA